MTNDDVVDFAVHVSNHRKVGNVLENAGWDIDLEKNDLGFEGTINDPVTEDNFVQELQPVGKYIVSLVFVVENENGTVSGYAYTYRNRELTQDKSSKNHDPELWHGIVYDGLHLDGKRVRPETS